MTAKSTTAKKTTTKKATTVKTTVTKKPKTPKSILKKMTAEKKAKGKTARKRTAKTTRWRRRRLARASLSRRPCRRSWPPSGAKVMSRPEVTKKIWNYIKSKKLNAGRVITPDATLGKVLGKKLDMLQIAKALSAHLK